MKINLNKTDNANSLLENLKRSLSIIFCLFFIDFPCILANRLPHILFLHLSIENLENQGSHCNMNVAKEKHKLTFP